MDGTTLKGRTIEKVLAMIIKLHDPEGSHYECNDQQLSVFPFKSV